MKPFKFSCTLKCNVLECGYHGDVLSDKIQMLKLQTVYIIRIYVHVYIYI